VHSEAGRPKCGLQKEEEDNVAQQERERKERKAIRGTEKEGDVQGAGSQNRQLSWIFESRRKEVRLGFELEAGRNDGTEEGGRPQGREVGLGQVKRRLTVAAAVAAVAASILIACGGAMRPEELARSIDTLSSSAAEGSLLASDVARHRTKATFARARARELGEVVDHEAEKLSDATPRKGIRDEKLAAVNLADGISQALGQIQISPDDSDTALEAERKLEDLKKRGEALSKSL
jgi:hypothetical protein